MYVDISKDQLLPMMEKEIVKQMEKVMRTEVIKIVIDKIEWNENGLRVWIQTPK